MWCRWCIVDIFIVFWLVPKIRFELDAHLNNWIFMIKLLRKKFFVRIKVQTLKRSHMIAIIVRCWMVSFVSQLFLINFQQYGWKIAKKNCWKISLLKFFLSRFLNFQFLLPSNQFKFCWFSTLSSSFKQFSHPFKFSAKSFLRLSEVTSKVFLFSQSW